MDVSASQQSGPSIQLVIRRIESSQFSVGAEFYYEEAVDVHRHLQDLELFFIPKPLTAVASGLEFALMAVFEELYGGNECHRY